VVKEISVTAQEAERFRLQKGDLLLTEGGDPDKLGRGTVWNDELPWCLHQNHVFRVRPRTDVVPLYLSWYLASPAAKSYFLRMAKQTTGIASINKTQLSATPVKVPPLELQQTFASRVAAVERLKESHRRHLAELDALFASLQHRAFKGEL
jgi:type I restriction enzyme S subunit